MFRRIREAITTYALAMMPTLYNPPSQKVAERKSLAHRLNRTYVWRIKAEVETWRLAIQAAESPIMPDRRSLYSIYRETELNSEVITQTRVASYTVRRAPFQLSKNGTPDDKIKERFEKKWFDDLMALCVETEWYGHTLIEFDAIKTPDGDFKSIVCVPRDLVRPEYGDVLLTSSDSNGIDYRDAKIFPYLLEVGNPWDLGLFKVVSLPVIRMKYSDSDWSLFSERFGMPIMAIKTATRDKGELDEIERMAQNMGNNGYVILDDTDSVDFMNGNSGGSPHQVFSSRIDKAENQIAKLINGQSSTSDEKAHVGSAEVHERILNNFTYARLRNIQFFVNETLIPFLIGHGYPLDGYKFQFTELIEVPKNVIEDTATAPKAKGQKSNTDATQPSAAGQKKKSSLSLSSNYKSILQHYKIDDCCNMPKYKKLKLNFSLSDLIQNVAQDIYTQRTQAGDMNIDLWRENFQQLMKAAEKGYGKSYLKTSYADPDKEVLSQLRYNAMVFAAFKNHSNIADIVAMLRDAAGNIRPFADFKNDALQVSKNYNVAWLKTEYDSAIGAARMAANWNHIKQEHGEENVLLRYITIGDDRVRLAHQKLDGVTLPMADEFWQKYYPPNGWNCRCDVEVIYGEPKVEPTELPTDTQVPPTFRFNPGQTNQLFSEEHPYFQGLSADDRKNIIKQMNKFEFDDFNDDYYKDTSIAKETFKKIVNFPNSLGYDTESGGYVTLHKTHGFEAILDELPVAIFLKSKGYGVELLDESKQNGNEPDALINGTFFEIKRMSNTTNINGRFDKYFESAARKAKHIIIDINQDISSDQLKAALDYAKKRNPKIKTVWIVRNKTVKVFDMNK